MKRRIVWISLLVSLAVWATFSWPLPWYITRGIPFSGLYSAPESGGNAMHGDPLQSLLRAWQHHTVDRTEMLIPGDHLRLLYHFWLITDMMAGQTPLFSNIYEFNTGNDEEHYRPDTCFFPFPLPYALGSWIGGPAFGYNLTAFLAFWLSYLLTWLLTMRYCQSRALAAVAALVSVFLPYRWHALLGGSPAGLAMMWIPAILLGTDIAVKESRITGGILAGAALLLASMSDQHIFFFGALAVPGWCLIALAARSDFKWKSPDDYLCVVRALVPIPLFLAAGYWLSMQVIQRTVDTTDEVINVTTHWNTGIFCLVPTLLAVACALSCRALSTLINKRWWKVALPVLVVGIVFADCRQCVKAGICLLQPEQGAYRAIDEDARTRGTVPRAVAVPLLPGDSAQSLPYMYYASLYRVRMLNDYNPVIRRNYANEIYFPFEKINQGALPDDRIDALRRMKIDYVLLHEDMFPEVVSPFPVTFTLMNLLNNPRLKLLDCYDQTWAFRILAGPEERPPVGAGWNTRFPAWHKEAEACQSTNVVSLSDKSAGGGIYVKLSNAGSLIEPRLMRMSFVPDLRYMVRVRGSGTFTAEILLDNEVIQSPCIPVQTTDWTWTSIPVPQFDGYRSLRLRICNPNGLLDVDYLLLMAGEWEWNPPLGQSVSLPAPLFSHAGHINLDKDSVFLQANRRFGTAFSGPKLPLAVGKYRIELFFSTPAAPGADLGCMIVEHCEDARIGAAPVIAGKPAVFELDQTVNMPINVIFSYSGKADMDITSMTITRLE